MEAREFTPVIVQAAVFTPDEGLVVPRFANELAPRWRTRFDGAPAILPSVPGMLLPADLPRAVLQSADGAWRFEVGTGRASVTCSATGTGFPIAVDAFYREATALLVEYRQAFQLRVGRLGAILTRVLEGQARPGIALARHFCAERWWSQPLNRPESFELHAHKRYSVEGWGQVNSWMRVRTGQLAKAGGVVSPVISTEQDINTLPEEAASKSYTDEQTGAFFGLVPREFDTILRLYFPEPAP